IVNHPKSAASLSAANGDSEYGACRALYDYHTEREDELHLRKGDVIVIHRKEEDGWWYGSINEKRGIFPATYVEEFIPPTAKSLTVEDETSL
ncbi:Nostrin, partial [Varanus komodoensis]